MKYFIQVGWFSPQSHRFCYTDEKDVCPDSHKDYNIPVFAIDKDIVSQLSIQLGIKNKICPWCNGSGWRLNMLSSDNRNVKCVMCDYGKLINKEA